MILKHFNLKIVIRLLGKKRLLTIALQCCVKTFIFNSQLLVSMEFRVCISNMFTFTNAYVCTKPICTLTVI